MEVLYYLKSGGTPSLSCWIWVQYSIIHLSSFSLWHYHELPRGLSYVRKFPHTQIPSKVCLHNNYSMKNIKLIILYSTQSLPHNICPLFILYWYPVSPIDFCQPYRFCLAFLLSNKGLWRSSLLQLGPASPNGAIQPWLLLEVFHLAWNDSICSKLMPARWRD